MTDTDAMRDELARLCGWHKDSDGVWRQKGDAGISLWPGDDEREAADYPHPFPTNDLTALAAAWPEGWGIMLNKNYANGDDGQWYGVAVCIWGPRPLHREELMAPTEYEARLRLTMAVLKAGRDG